MLFHQGYIHWCWCNIPSTSSLLFKRGCFASMSALPMLIEIQIISFCDTRGGQMWNHIEKSDRWSLPKSPMISPWRLQEWGLLQRFAWVLHSLLWLRQPLMLDLLVYTDPYAAEWSAHGKRLITKLIFLIIEHYSVTMWARKFVDIRGFSLAILGVVLKQTTATHYRTRAKLHIADM